MHLYHITSLLTIPSLVWQTGHSLICMRTRELVDWTGGGAKLHCSAPRFPCETHYWEGWTFVLRHLMFEWWPSLPLSPPLCSRLVIQEWWQVPRERLLPCTGLWCAAADCSRLWWIIKKKFKSQTIHMVAGLTGLTAIQVHTHKWAAVHTKVLHQYYGAMSIRHSDTLNSTHTKVRPYRPNPRDAMQKTTAPSAIHRPIPLSFITEQQQDQSAIGKKETRSKSLR